MTEKLGLYQKIARIMGRLDRMPKTGFNQHFKYKFVTDADVADAVRAELAAENIAFFASMVHAVQEGGHTKAEFEFTFACGDTGETITLQWQGEADDKQDKGLSKAATSAEKYFLLKTFMLSTGDKDDDPDNDAPSPERHQRPVSTPKSSARPSDGTNTRQSPQNAPSDVQTVDDIVLLHSDTWGSIAARLVDSQLANHASHAFNRLKVIAAQEIDGFDPKSPWSAINAAKWSEGDLRAKFEARIAEKQVSG